MGKLLLSKNGIYILAGLALVVLLLYFLKIVLKKREAKKEMRRAATDRMRDENLNSFILNSHPSSNSRKAYVPYEVDYSGNNQKENQQIKQSGNKLKSDDVMLQITEKTGLSSRKFVLNASTGIRIGTLPDCHITIIDDANNDYLCEIVAVSHKEVYVRDAGNSRIIIRRKKEQAIVDDKGIKIKSGDNIVMGNFSYSVIIIK